MGLYDRDYYQQSSREREYYHIQPQQSWVFAIIVVNIMVYFANAVRGGDSINDLMVMHSTTLPHPTEWWRLVTYAFAHGSFTHLFFNMLALFFFGPLIERRHGPIEFVCFYFTTAILAGVAWGTFNLTGNASMLGASGAISGVVMVAICTYPRMMVMVWFVLEMPMWLMGVIFIAGDLFGFFGYSGGDRVAHEAHLAGVAIGAAYWWLKLRFTDFPLLFSRQYWKERQRRKRFFDPKNYTSRYNYSDDEEKKEDGVDAKLQKQVDEILQKISEKGQNSLTWNERRILKRGSKEFKKKNKPK